MHWILLILLVANALCGDDDTAKPPELHDLHIREDDYFLLVCDELESAQTVATISQRLHDLSQRYFPYAEAFEHKIVLQLIRKAEAEVSVPYVIKLDNFGEVRISLYWNASTRLEDTCEAIARGYLKKWTLNKHGYQAAHNVPAWLGMAYSKQLIAKLKPSLKVQWQSEARRLPTLSIGSIIDSNAIMEHPLPLLKLHAYWLFEFLEDQSDSNKAFKSLLSEILETADTGAVIQKRLVTNTSQFDPVLWWATGIQDLARGSLTPILTMEDSRTLILDLTRVAILINGNEQVLPIEKLWNLKNEPSVQSAILWRLREIKVNINKINPAYMNAMHSLGRSYELLFEEDRRLFHGMLATFKKDIAASMELDASIQKHMQSLKRL